MFSIKKYITITILFFSCILSNAQNTISSDNNIWQLKRNTGGIKVYTKKVNNSDILVFKAVTIINAGFSKVASVIQDTKYCKQWMDRVKTIKILKKINNNNYYTYIETFVPWPFSNRDIILLYNVIKTDKSIIIKLTSIPDYIPNKPGIVRMKEGTGYWKISKINYHKSLVEYSFFSDPGGNLPNWLTNTFIEDVPFNTLKNLRKIFSSTQ
ncbi:MAG TPA: hypothetical protein ENI82_04905 [Bacteroidetes bacterium]|nr:hypothetical protein [Bacteroidota bacterium]